MRKYLWYLYSFYIAWAAPGEACVFCRKPSVWGGTAWPDWGSTELDRRWLGRGSCRHLCPAAGSALELGALVDSVQNLLVPSVTSLLFWPPGPFCSGKPVLLIIITTTRMTTPYVCKALSIFRNTFAPLISLDFPIISLRLVGPPHCTHVTDLEGLRLKSC